NAIGHPAGGQLQTARQTHLQDGPAASSFRGAGLAGVEDHRAILDCRTGDGAICAHYVETAMKALVVGMERSGLASLELLKRRGTTITATDSRPIEEMPKAVEALRRMDVPFRPQSPDVFEGHDWIVL